MTVQWTWTIMPEILYVTVVRIKWGLKMDHVPRVLPDFSSRLLGPTPALSVKVMNGITGQRVDVEGVRLKDTHTAKIPI